MFTVTNQSAAPSKSGGTPVAGHLGYGGYANQLLLSYEPAPSLGGGQQASQAVGGGVSSGASSLRLQQQQGLYAPAAAAAAASHHQQPSGSGAFYQSQPAATYGMQAPSLQQLAFPGFNNVSLQLPAAAVPAPQPPPPAAQQPTVNPLTGSTSQLNKSAPPFKPAAQKQAELSASSASMVRIARCSGRALELILKESCLQSYSGH